MKFYQHARDYIERLIKMQRRMDKRYRRNDHARVFMALSHLDVQLCAYPYDTDAKMQFFWLRYRNEIKLLIPRPTHSAHTKLLCEFVKLDTIAMPKDQLDIWNSVSKSLHQ